MAQKLDRPIRCVVDCSSGQVRYEPFSDLEWEQLERDRAEAEKRAKEEEKIVKETEKKKKRLAELKKKRKKTKKELEEMVGLLAEFMKA